MDEVKTPMLPNLPEFFIEVNQKNIGELEELIVNSLESASVIGLSLHSSMSSEVCKKLEGETHQQIYARIVKAAITHEIYAIGITCAELSPSVDSGRSKILIRNFNLTCFSLESNIVDRESLLRMTDMGYDLNYVTSNGLVFYRGRNDINQQPETAKVLRRIFSVLHGSSTNSPPVVLRENGLSDVIFAYTSMYGLPGETCKEFSYLLHDLFPGKLIDCAAMRAEIPSAHISYPVYVFPETVKDAQIRLTKLLDSTGGNCGKSRANSLNPPVSDSFKNVDRFIKYNCYHQTCRKDTEHLCNFNLEGISNRLYCDRLSEPVRIEPNKNSKFTAEKRMKTANPWSTLGNTTHK